MQVCSGNAVVNIAQWFAYSEQNIIGTKRCSGDIDTEPIFAYINSNLPIVFAVLVFCLVALVILYIFNPSDIAN